MFFDSLILKTAFFPPHVKRLPVLSFLFTSDWPPDVPPAFIFFVPRCQLRWKPPRLSKALWFQSNAIPNSHNSISSHVLPLFPCHRQ